jgi:hypothetical protein
LILVDDVLLADRLRDDGLGRSPTLLATTCSWWWRLASAAHGERGGALTRRMSVDGQSPRDAISRLREHVQILDQRDLIPSMARAAGAFRLNLLAAEALVAAEVLGADVVVGQDTPRLREAARVRGITYLVQA